LKISGGNFFNCALMSDSSIACWGYNVTGQLGDGTTTDRSRPTFVPGLTGAVDVGAGIQHTCARYSDRTVRCWGDDRHGQLGDNSTTGYKTAPTYVTLAGGAHFLADEIAVGGNGACGRNGSTVYCWGDNSFGQIGDNTTTDRPVATPILTTAGAVQLAHGANHACMITTTGSIHCWGSNAHGEIGDGTTTDRHVDVYVAAGLSVLRAGYYSTCAFDGSGNLKCWGSTATSFSDLTSAYLTSPTVISGILVTDVAIGWFHHCALRTDGSVACWRGNTYGELGDGTFAPHATPAAVPGLASMVSVGAGDYHSCAIKTGGAAWCWGDDVNGQIGDGASGAGVYRTSPTLVLW
jgi:alpha-tubulin suppressor-like RCC1 family protein